MSEAVELKSCPFCGGEAEVNKWHYDGPNYTCRCRECGACAREYKCDKPAAIAAWNRRVEPASPPGFVSEQSQAVRQGDVATDADLPASDPGHSLTDDEARRMLR